MMEVGMAFPRKLAHELDAAWIIALWKAIHGGDPAPDQRIVLSEREAISIARQAANVLVGYVAAVAAGDAEAVSAEAHHELSQGLHASGFELLSPHEPQSHQPPPYCFRWNGQTICIPRPRVTHVIDPT
jgi:hypothetical protein